MRVYLDLETIPTQNPRVIQSFKDDAEKEKQFIKAPANYKDELKIVEYIAQKSDEIDADIEQNFRRTSFDGGYGHICVIGYALDDQEPITLYEDSMDFVANEKKIISDFYEILRMNFNASSNRSPEFIGHNIIGFDLRFLFQRSIVLGINPPSFIPFDAKPWSDKVFDTMTKWAGDRNKISLNKLCDIFNLPLKGAEFDEEFDGSMVWDAVASGNIEKVATYCAGDIYRTREIHKRIAFV